MPKISVVIPVFNEGELVRRCAQHIKDQTLGDWELIFVDDGSTDGSGEVIDELAAADDRIKAIHQENRGASAARNRGIEAATGEYLMFSDCDDWYEPQAFNIAVHDMDEHGLDLLFGGLNTRIFTDDGKTELTCAKSAPEDDMSFHMADFDTYGPKVIALSAMMFFCIWDKVYRTDVIKRNHIRFNENIVVQEDVTFVYDYYFHCDKCMVSKEVLYNYTREQSKDDVADLDVVDQWACITSPLCAFLRLNCKFNFSEEFVHTVYNWTFLHFYSLSAKIYYDSTGLSQQEQDQHIRALLQSFPFLFFKENMSSYDPFWKRMKELSDAGDTEQLLVEWKQKTLGGWTVDSGSADSWANKSEEQLSSK